ncbi:MAG: TolC family protein [Armatimonadia bacterium]
MPSRLLVCRLVVCVIAAGLCFGALAQSESPSPPSGAPLQLTLQQALDQALRCHPDVLSAQAAVVQARAQARIQEARRWPTVDLEGSVNKTQSLGRPSNVGGVVIVSSGQRSTQRDAAAVLNYNVYETTREREIRRAQTLAEAQAFGVPDAQRLLAFEVRQAYYNILAQRQLARAMMQSLAAAERHRDMVAARIEAGTAPESDLLPVEVEVAQARLDSVQAETQLDVALASLKALLQLPVDTTLHLADTLPEGTFSGTAQQLVTLAEQARPDVSEQRLNVRAAQLATEVAKQQRGVQLEAGASADYGRHTGVTGEAWSLQVGATYPLFDAGSARAAAVSAQAQQEQAVQRLSGLLLNLQRDVESALQQLRQTTTGMEVASVARRSAENSLAAAEARYKEGLAIIIEVTDAQVALLQAQVSEVQARYDHSVALASLTEAVGCDPTAAPVEQKGNQ